MKNIFFLFCAASMMQPLFAQKATVTETVESVKTYPFSDPDPVADPSDLFYPYFRFDGFSAKGIDKQWKVVSLENDYIKLTLFPEVGGKVWGAVDKTTGMEFIYNNHVVKFRDIAMRGPWTSGGIEFNFGIIGHAPTSSTPVDYVTRQKPDGSVSCYVSSYELVTRTLWTVEVNLPKDKAYFTTTTTWHNCSSIDQPYYQWMNAGYPANGNAEFCYPGTNYIGHDGELHPFPFDEEGHDISWYEKNNFGPSKSYHVVGKYNDFYGAYWHDKDLGSIHHADYGEKLGMAMFGTTDVVGKTFEVSQWGQTFELKIVGVQADNSSTLLNMMGSFDQVEFDMPITTFASNFGFYTDSFSEIMIYGDGNEHNTEVAQKSMQLLEARHRVTGQGVVLVQSFTNSF